MPEVEAKEDTKEVRPSENEKDTEDEDVNKPDSCKDDHPVFEAIKNSKDDIEVVRDFFEINGISVETQDSSGMTVLMHACWKGYQNIAKFLIKQGADVNGGDHEHGYTTLHFAALSNKIEICQILLENDVKVDRTNSVKRTASQMAAFVGNHECVSVINNYVQKEDVYYFTRKQPLETEPKLPLNLAKPIHNLVMSMNTHPVKMAMVLKESPELLANLPKVCQILELMSDREFKNRRDVNEVLSLKYHIIHYILKDIKKQMEKDASSDTEKKTPFIDRWIKSMIIGRETDGYQVFQENFLRQGVKEFPFQESQLFKTLVTNFHHCKNYGEGATAADYINQAFKDRKASKILKIATHVVQSRLQPNVPNVNVCHIAIKNAKSYIGLRTKKFVRR